jgi:hypothetical protein
MTFKDVTLVHLALGSLFVILRGALARFSALERFANAFGQWAFLLYVGSTAFAAVGWEIEASREYYTPIEPWILIAALVLTLGALASQTKLLRDRSAMLATIFGLVHFAGGITTAGPTGVARQLLGFVLFAAFAICWIVYEGRQGHKRAVNFGLFALSLRILIAFFQLFDDLTTTGVSLLLTGMVLIGCAMAWRRVSERVLALSGNMQGEP